MVYRAVKMALFSKTQLFDDHPIPIRFHSFQVSEQPSPLSDQLQQSTAGMMIPFVSLEMLCQIPDPFAKKSNLNLG